MQTITTLNEPPPSYDCVIALDEVISRKRTNLYTFKGLQHLSYLDRKDCIGFQNESAANTPQVSLDAANCDNQSPSNAASVCNCNCAINQNYMTNLCANCNNVIDNMNNNVTYTLATISGGNIVQDNCPLSSDTNCTSPPKSEENDSSNDQSNNNDYNGNRNLFSPVASPSTSTSANYISLTGERQKYLLHADVDDEDGTDGNGNCQPPGTVSLSTINQNGLIRLDMSQIIDQTGLPTYEAALQLKSSGYV